jgi:hypothetical protein
MAMEQPESKTLDKDNPQNVVLVKESQQFLQLRASLFSLFQDLPWLPQFSRFCHEVIASSEIVKCLAFRELNL